MTKTFNSNTTSGLSIAALTFTYNEHVNLPIWIKHYGAVCGEQNLFIADRGSDDGSIENVGAANLLRLPRNEFDEFEKTDFVNHMQAALLKFYDVVICTDCDEMLLPDPSVFPTLNAYINQMTVDCVRAIGIDVLHIIDHELPLDFAKPILSQRGSGRFGSPSCKAMISKVPIRWLPGFHSCDRKVEIDESLLMFHLKFMDYNIACKRQRINVDTVWSQDSLDKKFGSHHRWDMETFVHRGFFVPSDVYRKGEFVEFELNQEIRLFDARTSYANGSWYIPMDLYKWVKIPSKYSSLL